MFNWEINYKESYAPKVDFEVTLVEKISSDLTEILEYGVPITIHNSKKPSVHEEGLVYLNGYIRMIYNKATKSVYRLNYLSKKINIFNKDKSSLVKDGIRVIRDIVKALAEDSGGVMVHAAAISRKKLINTDDTDQRNQGSLWIRWMRQQRTALLL